LQAAYFRVSGRWLEGVATVGRVWFSVNIAPWEDALNCGRWFAIGQEVFPKRRLAFAKTEIMRINSARKKSYPPTIHDMFSIRR
jgi:hypothetical protein